MSVRRGGTARPVIVEVKPDNASNLAPSSPSTSPRVRFASTATNGVSRPLTSVEIWSLYHFETHARACHACQDLLDSRGRNGRLCAEGHALAQDAALHVQYRDGEYYEKPASATSTKSPVRVEVPHGYTMLKALLKAIERRARSSRPIVTYDRPSTRRMSTSTGYDSDPEERGAAIIEPARSASHRSRHRSTRYATRVVDPETADVRPTLPSRRGTLYENEMQRQKANYRVEIREPSSSAYAGSRRERPRSLFWS